MVHNGGVREERNCECGGVRNGDEPMGRYVAASTRRTKLRYAGFGAAPTERLGNGKRDAYAGTTSGGESAAHDGVGGGKERAERMSRGERVG
jgi:hypothetical protein